MLLTNKEKSEQCRKHRLSGMTLIEVTVGMVIIIIVTLIAYMGVSASANFTVRGTDLRNADGPAVSMMEAERKKAESGETPVNKKKINYSVTKIKYTNDEASPEVTAVVTETFKENLDLEVKVIEAEATENDAVVKYNMYLP
ncbi:MAG: type II secretion system protein [Oscillospiraceae bacterium]|nr:type II secretion system protein [Oscillospiraceae bacterium]